MSGRLSIAYEEEEGNKLKYSNSLICVLFKQDVTKVDLADITSPHCDAGCSVNSHCSLTQ